MLSFVSNECTISASTSAKNSPYPAPGAQIRAWIPEPIEVEAYVRDAGALERRGVGARGSRDVVTARREGGQKRNPQVVIFAADKE